jgi:hypothetical protein
MGSGRKESGRREDIREVQMQLHGLQSENGMIPSDLERIRNKRIANHDGSKKRDV